MSDDMVSFSPARRGQRAAAPPAPILLFAYAASGKGRPRPLHSLRGACAPSNPDSMHSYAERLARMPTGKLEPAAHDHCLGKQSYSEGQPSESQTDTLTGRYEVAASIKI